jgi:hypothetical protein
LPTFEKALQPHLSGRPIDEPNAKAHLRKRLDCHDAPGRRGPRGGNYSSGGIGFMPHTVLPERIINPPVATSWQGI